MPWQRMLALPCMAYRTFNWPAGMPRTMFIGQSNVGVVDPAGRTMTIHTVRMTSHMWSCKAA